MLRKFAEGKIVKKILPGSDTQSTIPRSDYDSFASHSSYNFYDHDGRDYVNTGLEEYDRDDEYEEVMFLLIYSDILFSVNKVSTDSFIYIVLFFSCVCIYICPVIFTI